MTSSPSLSREFDRLAADNARLREMLRQAGIEPDLGPDDPSSATAQASETTAEDERALTRLLLDTASEGFCAVDRNGVVTLCNEALIQMLGAQAAAQLIGQPLHAVVQRGRPAALRQGEDSCPITLAARQGSSRKLADALLYRWDGTSFPMECRAEPLIRGGQLLGAICTFVDQTERLHVEAQLRDSEHRFTLAVAAAEVGIWDYSPATGLLRWDDRTRELFGLSPGREISLDDNLAAIHADDRSLVDAALAAAFDPAGPGRYEVEFRAIGMEDGAERWLSAKGQTSFAGGEPRRFLGTVRDVTEAKRAELHLRLMVNELNHRVKNSLAMVQGVASQTFRSTSDVQAARVAFTERLVALARAHDLLTATNWGGSDLHTVVGLTAASHVGDGADRFDIDGCPVTLSPKAVLSVSMALHELATNAMKNGALSNERGRVALRWKAMPSSAGNRLHFQWIESGGPVVSPPQSRGFGSKMIERGLAAELQGEVRIEFPETGVVCTMDVPFPSP